MSDQKNITKAEDKVPERVSRRATVSPPVDIYENPDEVLVVTDVPGTAPEGLNVHFDKDQLFIEASAAPLNEDHNPLFREFASVDYRRVFELAPRDRCGEHQRRVEERRAHDSSPQVRGDEASQNPDHHGVRRSWSTPS